MQAVSNYVCVLHNYSRYIYFYISRNKFLLLSFTGHKDIINFFGLNGDGLDRSVTFSFRRNIHILCGSSLEGVQLDWFFSNGTKVGNTNRNVREGHFRNGTASLQIASDRNVGPCDSGMYSCRANQSGSGRVEQRTFTLTVDREF